MRFTLATDLKGRAVRCPVCDKPVRISQRVVIRDGKPTHAKCAPPEEES